MKKGFTIIEIIISIGLITLIGTISIAFIKNSTNKNKEIEKFNNLFLDATNLFIKNEVDDDGDNYNESLQTTNSRGVKIPLTYLVEKGYVTDADLSKLKSLNNLTDENYYILALKGENKENNYCDEGETSIILPWTMEEKEPVYLCDKNQVDSSNSVINVTFKSSVPKFTNNFDKFAVSEEWCKNNPDYDTTKIVCDENGIFTYYNEDGDIVYNYARGAVKNNYLKFQDKMWRIVWVSSENKMKLVLDEEIKITLDNGVAIEQKDRLIKVVAHKPYTGKSISLNNYNDIDFKLEVKGETNITFWHLNSNIINKHEYESTRAEKTYRITYDLDKAITINDETPYNVNGQHYQKEYQYSKNNIYYKIMSSNINDENFMYNVDEFCVPFSTINDDIDFIKSSNKLNCKKISKNIINMDEYKIEGSSKVTYLTMDELIMAGVVKIEDEENIINLDNSGNYLLPTDNNTYYLSETSTSQGTKGVYNYYVSKDGISLLPYINTTDRPWCKGAYTKNYKVFYINGSYCKDKYCMTKDSCNDIKQSEFVFNANTVKPAVIIDLTKVNKITLLLNQENSKILFSDILILLQSNDKFINSYANISDSNKSEVIKSLQSEVNAIKNDTTKSNDNNIVKIMLYVKPLTNKFIGLEVNNSNDIDFNFPLMNSNINFSLMNNEENTYKLNVTGVSGTITGYVKVSNNSYEFNFNNGQDNINGNIDKIGDNQYKIKTSFLRENDEIEIDLSIENKINETVTLPNFNNRVNYENITDEDKEMIITKLYEKQAVKDIINEINIFNFENNNTYNYEIDYDYE